MELTHHFTVPVPIDVAWQAFNDLEQIAPCFPGAALTSYDGDAFEGLCKVKLGPISLQYAGTGRFVERDEASHRAVIEAKGKDKRGNGTASAGVTAQLTASGDSATDVTVKTDLNITGRPAQFGRGVMQDVSDKLLGQFASCLETKLGANEPPVEDTPIAAEAAAASKAADGEALKPRGAAPRGASEGLTSPTSYQTARAPSSESAASTPAAALDLGATVIPVLLKRYAPHIIGGLLVLWVLKKTLGRSHR